MGKRLCNPKINTYTAKERNMYLLGLCGQNMIYNIITTGMYFYFQSVIFIPAIAISIFMAAARVWDAVNDPIMGTIVDRTRTKWGKCRPYLMFCPAAIGIFTVLTFINGVYSADNSAGKNALIVGWAAISYILFGMLYTVGDIPLWGITALMTEDEKDRSNILMLARVAATIGGGAVIVSIVPISQAVGEALNGKFSNNEQMGFIIVAVIMTIAATLMFQLPGIFVRERIEQPTDEHYTIKQNFKLMWNNKPFRQMLISGIIRSPIQLLINLAMTLLAYYYGDYYGNYMIYMLILGGAIFGGQFVSMAFTPKLAEKYEKKSVYNISAIVAGVAFALVFVAYLIAPQELHKPVWLVVCFVFFLIAGAGMGSLNVLQSIMIADAVDYEEYRNGIRPDGVFFSGQSFITKLSAGISSILCGVVYAIVGFSDVNIDLCNQALKAGASFKVEFSEYAAAMFFLVSIPPAIGCILSVVPTWKYALSNKEHEKILASLIEKRHSDENL